jgi:hypothetical protein
MHMGISNAFGEKNLLSLENIQDWQRAMGLVLGVIGRSARSPETSTTD